MKPANPIQTPIANATLNEWAKCNVCKKSIPFGETYWKCDVSTCNRVRFQLHFCSVDCWDAHIPGQRHRNASCTEQKAPKA